VPQSGHQEELLDQQEIIAYDMKKINFLIESVIKREVNRILKEQDDKNKSIDYNVQDDGLNVYKNSVGGLLYIPKDSEPNNFTYVDKSKFISELSSTEQIVAHANKIPYVKMACDKYHPQMDYDSCAGLFVQAKFNKWEDGGVLSFNAKVPGKTERKTFRACWRYSKNGVPLDFDEFSLNGYYSDSDSGGFCTGLRWSENPIGDSESGGTTIEQTYGDEPQDKKPKSITINLNMTK
jgi:hypothetical protein